MPQSYLTIPLNQPNPARQRLWRAAWLAALAGLGLIIGIVVYRLIVFRSHLLSWPDSAVIALRLPKTPENITDAGTFLPGIIMSKEVPFSIYHEFLRSNNEIIIFLDHHGQVAGFATDRNFSNQEKQAFSLSNINLNDSGPLTTLTTAHQTTKHRSFSLWHAFPQFDGSVSWLAENKISTSPLVLSPNSLSLRGKFSNYQGKNQFSLDNTQLLASFSAPAALASALIPDVPAAFPGLQNLTNHLEKEGFSLLLGQDDDGLAYIMSLENSSFSPESLGEISKELAQTPHLSTQDWTIDFQTYQEFRGSEVEVSINHDSELNRVTASGENGIVRATQSATTTILSNRQPNIGQPFQVIDPCLAQAVGFITPADLRELLPLPVIYQPRDLNQLLQESDRLSWSESTLKVCW